MKETYEILPKIITWAQSEETVRAALLIGSRATGSIDELSDYDVSIFTSQIPPYIRNNQWLSQIHTHWVCVHEKLPWKEKSIPTRLVIFEDGIKVDFAFYPLEALADLSKGTSLPADYDDGYQVLLDKDSLAASMPAPTYRGYLQQKPTQEEFLKVVEEFWFEAYHVAKYLKRNDLWRVKFRDWGMKDPFLLSMINWNEAAKRSWNLKTHSQGKSMQSYINKSTWKDLHLCFGHFTEEGSRKALEEAISLFRRLAIETAELLSYTYPYDIDENISGYMQKLETN
jgi:aminoglycoside 6-adenylyltransferase